jgi:type IV pilus assembly protein PilA
MLVKMRESKGFTLVELMIVVAIIGILAAVAVPYYQRYVAKSRLTSLVMPSVHAVETNISTFFAVNSTLPGIGSGTVLAQYLNDADTKYVSITGNASNELVFTVNINATNPAGKTPLKAIGTSTGGKNVFRGIPTKSSDGNKLYWSYAGTLAGELGL